MVFKLIRKLGKGQQAILKEFAKMSETQELFSQEIEELRKANFNTIDEDLNKTSINRVNDTLDSLFESL